MNRKFYLTLLAGLLSASGMQAAPISPEAAQGIARQFIGKSVSAQKMRKAPGAESLTLAHTFAGAKASTPFFYVFNREAENGYVLVSADDRLPQIIGFSAYGNFDYNHMPANMQGMIYSWQQQIEYLLSHPSAKALAPTKPEKAIAPLLGEIMWDQGDPYNRKCPNVTQYDDWGDPTGSKAPAATGCVATALGQIMYYHQWPETGSGSVSYTSKGDDTLPIEVTFEGYQYDWAKMLPSLTTSSPADAIEQVSTLLFHVGASFESIYGFSTGATDVSVAPALKKYFGYDKGISYLLRDFATEQYWSETIYEELSSNRPIAYGGVTRKREGHFFVLDGINDDGYYHINWGWSGMEDGYYLLSLLEPGQQGIGGADNGGAFHYYQNMIVGICPPKGEESAEQINFTSDYLTAYSKTVDRQGTAKLKANEVWNNSATPCTANLGFALVNSEGEIVYRQWVKQQVNYKIAHGESTLSCSFLIPDNIPEGTYSVRPIYQLANEDYATDHYIQFPQGRNDRYTAVVTDKNIVYSTTGTYQLSMLDVTTDTERIKSGVPTRFTVKLHNEGSEFHGPVQLRCFIKGKDKIFGRTDFPKKAIFVSIPHGDSELVFETTLDVPGSDNYVFRLWGHEGMPDEDGYYGSSTNLCSKEGFTIEGPALPPVLSISDDLVAPDAVNGVVPRNDVNVKVYIENEGAEWSGKMRMGVYDPDDWSGKAIGFIEFAPVKIEAETEMWITLEEGEFPEAAETGKEYELVLRDPISNEMMNPSYYNELTLTVGEAIEKNPKLSLKELTLNPESPEAGKPATLSFAVNNEAYAYSGNMYFTVSKGNEVVHTSATQEVTVPREQEAVIDFTDTFELPTGNDYRVALLDKDDNEIGAKEGVSFTADESKLEMTSVKIEPEGEMKKGDKAKFTFDVTNSGFRYDGTIAMDIVLDDAVKLSSTPEKADIARGASATLTYDLTMDLPAATNYVVRLTDAEGKTIGEHKYLTIKDVIGVEGVDSYKFLLRNGLLTVPGAKEISIFSADGQLLLHSQGETLDTSALSNGVYITVVSKETEKVTAKFVK